MTEHRNLTEELNFDAQIQIAGNGFFRGIMIMWKEHILKLDNISVTPQGIHVMDKVIPNSHPWLFSAIYASSGFHTMTQLWDDICSLSHRFNSEWLIRGDFNKVLHAREKLGGNNTNKFRTGLLCDSLNQCKMIDLRVSGCKYTWTNK
ncbi:hypothetical protein KY284_020275 [Solanum tuberosum]|nr:hypothetical protein KY284_020275 [Solanum tuberosum]